MTPEQRYFFDLTGYLHLEQVVQGDELEQAQQAAREKAAEAASSASFGSRILAPTGSWLLRKATGFSAIRDFNFAEARSGLGRWVWLWFSFRFWS